LTQTAAQIDGPVYRDYGGRYLPGSVGNPRGRGSKREGIVDAMSAELAKMRPDGRTNAERFSELVVKRSIEELESPVIVEEGADGKHYVVQQAYPVTRMLMARMLPPQVVIRMPDGQNAAVGSENQAIDVAALSPQDRVVLLQLAQRYALAKGSHSQGQEGANVDQQQDDEGAGEGSGQESSGAVGS
jgi:hypothetical protein